MMSMAEGKGWLLATALVLTLAAVSACDDGGQENPNGGDAEAEAENETADSPVRAVELSDAAQGIGGPNAVARAGDFLLENERVRFVVQGLGPARSWVPYGGTLVDADVVREGAGRDLLGELTPLTAFIRAFKPTEAEIVADGSDGETAHVRFHGIDVGIPIIDSALPLPGHGLAVTMDYELARGSNALKVTTTIEASKPYEKASLGDGVVWGNRSRVLTSGFGWGLNGLAAFGPFDLQISIGLDDADGAPGPVYGLFSTHGPFTVLTDLADILPYLGHEEEAPVGKPISYVRWFVVGESVNEVYQVYADARGVETGGIVATVAVADEQDAGGRFDLEVIGADGVVAQYARVVPGETTLVVPPGRYTLRLGGEGRSSVESAAVEVAADGEATASLTAPATGRVAFTVGGDHFDGSTRDRLPAKLTLQAGLDAAVAAPVLRRVYTASGAGTFLLEPGDYTVTASRGYEYELDRQNLSVAAGETAAFDAWLVRSVDTTGWVAGDLHIHTERSIDAVVPVEDRVIQCAAEGLERMPITDHDTISNLDPLVEPLGLRDYIRITAGDEVSPIPAHTNGYPMTLREDRPAYYGVEFWQGWDDEGNILDAKTNPEIWAFMREEYDAGIIQINHPRSGQGYFNDIKYDPLIGVSGLKDGDFDTNWDAVELVNSGSVEEGLTKVVPDWFSLLNQGIHKAGVAVSDSHSLADPGQARSYLRTGVDDPNAIDDALLVDTIRSMRVQAASGPFVEARIGTAGSGDTVDLQGEEDVALAVKVQAPSWMPVEWVRVFFNGELVAEVEELNEGVVRLDQTFTIPIDKDGWFVVMAGAPTATLAPEGPGQPVLTVANPIFVDLDGDGYEPPGLPNPADAARAFAELKTMGLLFDPFRHEHGAAPAEHRHGRCAHVAGLHDHMDSADRAGHGDLPMLRQDLRRLQDAREHAAEHAIGRAHRHGHAHRHVHAGAATTKTAVRRYGFGTLDALPFVAEGCARPDLVPTTVLR